MYPKGGILFTPLKMFLPIATILKIVAAVPLEITTGSIIQKSKPFVGATPIYLSGPAYLRSTRSASSSCKLGAST